MRLGRFVGTLDISNEESLGLEKEFVQYVHVYAEYVMDCVRKKLTAKEDEKHAKAWSTMSIEDWANLGVEDI